MNYFEILTSGWIVEGILGASNALESIEIEVNTCCLDSGSLGITGNMCISSVASNKAPRVSIMFFEV